MGMPNWVSRQHIEDRLKGNNSWDICVGMQRSGVPLDKKYYYMLANRIAGFVNMLIEEDGEEFGLRYLENISRPLVAAQFKTTPNGKSNVWAVWGAMNKNALEKTRKEVVSKKHEKIKEAMRVILQPK
jgi:hypothetical protein